jgi:formylmethanofuran dehydrogenase subunit E
MLIVNKYGRVVDVSEELATELLAQPDKFEIYKGQSVNRYGVKVTGFENYSKQVIDVNNDETEEFNPAKIKWIDTKKSGYPVDGAYSKSLQDERNSKDEEIAELKKMLRITIKENKDDGVTCKGCGEVFTPKNKAFKYCDKCRDERNR